MAIVMVARITGATIAPQKIPPENFGKYAGAVFARN